MLVRIAGDLEQLHIDAEAIGQPLLASLVELAKTEAEDALKTAASEAQFAAQLNLSVTLKSDLEVDLAAEVAGLKRD